ECLVRLGVKTSPFGQTASVINASASSIEVDEFLIRNGADANVRFRGPTPLHQLLDRSLIDPDCDCVAKLRCLLNAGADVNATCEGGWTPLAVYLRSIAVPDVLVVQTLLDAGADLNCDEYLHLLLSQGCSSPEVARLLTRQGVDVNKVSNNLGWTSLHCLCYSNVPDHHAFAQGLDILLDSGANVNAKDECFGRTPLHNACAHDSPRDGLFTHMINLLLTAGAEVDAVDNKGSTPLHLAISCQYDPNTAAIVDLLVTAGANVDATDGNGSTPLHLAALHGNIPAVERLIAAGASVKLSDLRGGGLLHYAACSPRPFLVSCPGTHFLANLDVNACDRMGLSPLHWAARSRLHNPANVEAIFNAGANINARDHRGRTPLHHAARLGTPQIAKRLVSAGANANVLDQEGNTPLILAVRAGSYEGAIQLLEAGVSAPEVAFEVSTASSLWRTESEPV
ncbi:hypothetical protein BOTBODRAFT_643852, partial [Botryobasidium botryosum FD-172 SS1]